MLKENIMSEKNAALVLVGERVGNILKLVTSKKVITAVAASALLLQVTSVPKIIAIGSIAVAYILAQGAVDMMKEKHNG